MAEIITNITSVAEHNAWKAALPSTGMIDNVLSEMANL